MKEGRKGKERGGGGRTTCESYYRTRCGGVCDLCPTKNNIRLTLSQLHCTSDSVSDYLQVGKKLFNITDVLVLSNGPQRFYHGHVLSWCENSPLL